MPDPVHIAEYDPSWATTFQSLRERLSRVLGRTVLAIEHVGSTAVPGLAAKPIIDIDIVIETPGQFEEVVKVLGSLGYEHEGDLGVAGREAFRPPTDLPKHHLYVVVAGHKAHTEHIVFRDHLRTHPQDALRYAEVKRVLARRFRNDRGAYTEGKTAIIQDILMSAKVAGRGDRRRHTVLNMDPVDGIVITGTIGAGKTTLAEAISEELHERGMRHALLDLDWLGQVYPIPEGHDPYAYELALRNLKDVWPNFKAVGANRAVIAGTLLNQEQRTRLQEALDGIDLTVVLVRASQEVREERIKRRDTGRLLEDFLMRTADLAHEIEAANIHDLIVEHNDLPPREMALDILRRIQWASEV